MKFASKEDIEAPIAFVFSAISDFDALERQALRRGADLQRTDTMRTNGAGMSWNASFPFRGKERKTTARLVAYDVPHALGFVSATGGLHGNVNVDLVALSPRRTRLSVEIDLSSNSLSARLLLQSLRLAKSNLTRRFRKRISVFADDIEDRFYRQG